MFTTTAYCKHHRTKWAPFIDVTSRHDWTGRHVRRVEPMHFGSVELVEQDGSTRSSRRARLVLHDKLDWLDTSNVSRRAKWTLGFSVQLNVVVTRLVS